MAEVTRLRQPELQYPRTTDPRVTVTVTKGGQAIKITLSAYEDFGRLNRLGSCALRLPLPTLRRLIELHDHKGDLSAVWKVLPAGGDVAEVHKAWEQECEYSTSHFYNGRPLLDNCSTHPPAEGNFLSGSPIDRTESDAPDLDL